jgi:organic radical activating enzyme
MFGKNPIRAPITDDGKVLQVQEIFHTIQGEGPFVGMPAIFVRLGGCNLACEFCDTEFESFQALSLKQIMQEITNVQDGAKTSLVVITGGEPMRQSIEPFCQLLIKRGFTVQIETNGTIFRQLPDAVSIICSPKTLKFGYSKIRPDLLAKLAAIKFVVSKTLMNYSQVAEVGQSEFGIPVYVQPMDECDEVKNVENTHYAIELAQKHGYRLSLQTHKFINIR